MITMSRLKLYLVAVFVLTMSLQYCHGKQAKFKPLDERVKMLINLSRGEPLIRLTPKLFGDLIGWKHVGQPVRNYAFVVLFTTYLRKCDICAEVNSEMAFLAQSWRQSKKFTSKLFFGAIDFDESEAIFQELGIKKVPVILFFGERKSMARSIEVADAEQMLIEQTGFSDQILANWVRNKTAISIDVSHRPRMLNSRLVIFIIAIVGILIFTIWSAIMNRHTLYHLYFNSTTWATVAIIFVCLMTSGKLWDFSNGFPMQGETKYIGDFPVFKASGMQHPAESLLAFFCIILISGCLISVIEAMKTDRHPHLDGFRSKAIMYGWVMIIVSFSILLAMVLVKNRSYSYSIFSFFANLLLH